MIPASAPNAPKNRLRVKWRVAVLAVLHFWWMRAGKNNFTEVWVYATVLAALLSARAWRFYMKNAAGA